MMSKRMAVFLWIGAALSAQVSAQTACPSWPTAQRFNLNGAEVTDQRTGLVWARCSVGQSWNGNTCTGTASTFTHEQALLYAASQSGWRLPNKRELSSLADRGCHSPAIDSAAFPNTANHPYWTSTPHVSEPGLAWRVDGFGNVSRSFRSFGSFGDHVRLVRASQ